MLFCSTTLLCIFAPTFYDPMKYLLILALSVITSCNLHHQYTKAENALDAGREFINALLQGDFDKASFYMLQDDENNKLLRQFGQKYRKQSAENKRQYQQAVINIFEVDEVTGKETIINYSNSYDKIGHKVKIVNVNGYWMVDFKYTFDGNL